MKNDELIKLSLKAVLLSEAGAAQENSGNKSGCSPATDWRPERPARAAKDSLLQKKIPGQDRVGRSACQM